jgi:hypothetical protein
MAAENTTEYYLKREQQERELAAAANDSNIKNIHLEMAEKYAALAAPDTPTRSKLSITMPK